jgi:hypothetical protein
MDTPTPPRSHHARKAIAIASMVGLTLAGSALAQERKNWFDDPFAQATAGLPGCPQAEGPLLTAEQMRKEAHYRAERGTSCWLAGTCSEPNAYRYDKRIHAAALDLLRNAADLANTTLWLGAERRFIYVKGCVSDPDQQARIENLMRTVPDVEVVFVYVITGTRAPKSGMPYRVVKR